MKKTIIFVVLGVGFILSAALNFKLFNDVKMWREQVVSSNTGKAKKFVEEIMEKQKMVVGGIKLKGKLLKYDGENNLVEIFSQEINDKIIVALDMEHTVLSVKVVKEGEDSLLKEGKESPEALPTTVKMIDRMTFTRAPEMEIRFGQVNAMGQPVAMVATFIIDIR